MTESTAEEDFRSSLFQIQNWDMMQNFRGSTRRSGWLSKRSAGRSHIMTEEEYKEYMRHKNEKQKDRGEEESVNLRVELQENIQPTLTQEYRRVRDW